jgi:hypothetical protein
MTAVLPRPSGTAAVPPPGANAETGPIPPVDVVPDGPAGGGSPGRDTAET